VPSDREIPRSVNEGTPIVAAKARSEAAESFRRLAALYNGSTPATTNGRGRFHLTKKRSK
jgi:MinD-like ATPase involved in chromosome partitioning or flagellar assembly